MSGHSSSEGSLDPELEYHFQREAERILAAERGFAKARSTGKQAATEQPMKDHARTEKETEIDNEKEYLRTLSKEKLIDMFMSKQEQLMLAWERLDISDAAWRARSEKEKCHVTNGFAETKGLTMAGTEQLETEKRRRRDKKAWKKLVPRQAPSEPLQFERIRFRISPAGSCIKERVFCVRRLLNHIGLKRKVLLISVLGKSVAEVYVATDDAHSVTKGLQDKSFEVIEDKDPMFVPWCGKPGDEIERNVVLRLKYLYNRAKTKNLKEAIIKGYPPSIIEQVSEATSVSTRNRPE